jgi:heme-degrading monooxygenase HmoA
MATMLIQNNVKEYAAWKKVFDSVDNLRKSYGMLSSQVYRDAGDPNKVTVIFKWNSVENAQKWGKSDDIKKAMEKAGVMGQPMIQFLNEV